MTSELPLRERKKVATRAALSHAAWSAMLSDGLDSVSPESVAAAVGVSSRTFRNYFAGVEEAIVDELAQRYLTLAAQVGDRPPGAPVWESLMQGLPAALPAIMGDRDDFRQGLQSSGTNISFHDTDPGGSGTASCAEMTMGTITIPLCYWQTANTLGMVMAAPDITGNGQSLGWSQLGDVMRKMRPDVEKPA